MTLQEMRRSKGLTQEQASKLLKISADYLSMLENNIRNPSDKLKIKMAELYDVSVVDIFESINFY